jgi:very-short-patch-repair endonuclease
MTKARCIDCKEKLSKNIYKRCKKCNGKSKIIIKNCADCDVRLSFNTSNRCRKCYLKSPEPRKYTTEQRKMVSKLNKQQWRDGVRTPTFYNTKPEIELKKVLKKMDITYTVQKNVEGKVYDFYLPDFNMLIETDGVYWHCRGDKGFPSNKDDIIANDREKELIATRNNYLLVRVWEDEIDKVWRIVR